jgi:hypothetical protein
MKLSEINLLSQVGHYGFDNELRFILKISLEVIGGMGRAEARPAITAGKAQAHNGKK